MDGEGPAALRELPADVVFFKEPALRASFQEALKGEEELLKGPFEESGRAFARGTTAKALARECFDGGCGGLEPALLDGSLYTHQERSVRMMYNEGRNVVVATGTASGKTECFLYPILFELYRQHLAGKLDEPGVRALVLYPMNALANDQRERLGEVCRQLQAAGSDFVPTFGQYIGETPHYGPPGGTGEGEAAPGELLYREQMRVTPPHILLTNYSMLEYLLMRPEDSPLFDDGRARYWQFLVLDEAHQYRGARGMEMGMLLRRLKQRLRQGGREGEIRCIATSATMSSGEGSEERNAVAEFAQALFGESFSASGVIFGQPDTEAVKGGARRSHAFLRALEGAFLVHRDGNDAVVLNRSGGEVAGEPPVPLEIALCRECGQHYYVGREMGGRLVEGIRDPSQESFGVDYYLPTTGEAATHTLCRRCGGLSTAEAACDCDADVPAKRCESDPDRPDQLRECAVCGYQRGSLGDPVQEIVHGSDGPNAVIATALHEVLPPERRKILAFADSRQEAAFFAWYAQDSYEKLRNRNLILRAMRSGDIDPEGLSIADLGSRLAHQWNVSGLSKESDTRESRERAVRSSIFAEALTEERRLSMAGVGLVKWTVQIPRDVELPSALRGAPWNLTDEESFELVGYLLEQLRTRRAVELPVGPGWPDWDQAAQWPAQSFSAGPPKGRKGVVQWGGPQSAVVRHFLSRLLDGIGPDGRTQAAQALMTAVWHALRERDRRHPAQEHLLVAGHGKLNGTFRLNPRWLRIKLASGTELWECDRCASLSAYNVRGICPRNGCPGALGPVDEGRAAQNHYRLLYESPDLPAAMVAEEHTAQIESKEARRRQDEFKQGRTHLLSSSTTFEVGVDLGDLDVVFLRNVPPEPFNYTQRVGRAGRRDRPGLALTYCRRNPHDLYHYADPENRVIAGRVQPPRLRMRNEKIILRHMVATSLSAFFKEEGNGGRFRNVEAFLGDWSSPRAVADVRAFCLGNAGLKDALRRIVPEDVHETVGLSTDDWVDRICGRESRFAEVEAEVRSDFARMEELRQELFRKRQSTGRVEARMRTVSQESTLNFLSRKAVIPKYGFPVDVVELDTQSQNSGGVALQRDLSQAIAEYAPGGRVVANKLEWASYAVKRVAGREWPVRHYKYDDARSFMQWEEEDPSAPDDARKYLIPKYGFVTAWSNKTVKPQGRAQRFYTTRPFFRGFNQDDHPTTQTILGVEVTQALPGTLVILCEGKNRSGFYICRSCGAHATKPKKPHRSPSNLECPGTWSWFSLGHELVTDVVRLKFPGVMDEWHAYSLGYAVLLGASEALDIPNTDLNVTITGVGNSGAPAIVLYDAVPGGAGLVAQLEQPSVLARVLSLARERVGGSCGCDSSCYGCLRSYRNQFAHPFLSRLHVAQTLEALGDAPEAAAGGRIGEERQLVEVGFPRRVGPPRSGQIGPNRSG